VLPLQRNSLKNRDPIFLLVFAKKKRIQHSQTDQGIFPPKITVKLFLFWYLLKKKIRSDISAPKINNGRFCDKYWHLPIYIVIFFCQLVLSLRRKSLQKFAILFYVAVCLFWFMLKRTNRSKHSKRLRHLKTDQTFVL